MAEFERDRISKGFADLTALLEDAAGLALEGQSSRRRLNLIKRNIEQVWPLLIACVAALATLERFIRKGEAHRGR